MKNIITAILLSVSTMSAIAAPTKIFEDHEETWTLHSETFGRTKDGVFVLVSKADKATNKTLRFYLGVDYDSCKNGFGEIYIKEAPKGEWESLAMFTRGGTTIGDTVSEVLCKSVNGTKLKSLGV